MIVSELIEELKCCDQNADVAIVTDWENPDEYGNLPTTPITGVFDQTYVDLQFGDDETKEVCFLI